MQLDLYIEFSYMPLCLFYKKDSSEIDISHLIVCYTYIHFDLYYDFKLSEGCKHFYFKPLCKIDSIVRFRYPPCSRRQKMLKRMIFVISKSKPISSLLNAFSFCVH